MKLKLKLLVPDKKGVGRRVKDAVKANGGTLRSFVVTREMRGVTEMDLSLDVESEAALTPVVEALERAAVTVVATRMESEAGGSGKEPPARSLGVS